MGFYSKVIFPRLCEFLLDTPFVAKHREELLSHARGNVLEIGFGTGLNLPYYPENVRKSTVVDPNIGMHRRAQKRIRESKIDVDVHVLSGERLPSEDGNFDCVVSTFTLCSIENVGHAIAEVYRVLRPNGCYLFLEHGLSPDARIQNWQRRLNWLEMHLADGCRLDRSIRELVTAQPFSSVEIAECYLERTPKTHGYLYRGIATK